MTEEQGPVVIVDAKGTHPGNLSRAVEEQAAYYGGTRTLDLASAPQYDAAAHIFNWGRNDQRIYRRMLICRVPGNFLNDREQADEALALASMAAKEGQKGGDIPRALVGSVDLLRAAILILEWDGES